MSDPEFLPDLEFVGIIITVTEALWWYLTLIPLAFGKRGGVLLQDPETAPSVLVFKMVLKVVPGPR